MSTHDITIAGYLAILLAAAALQVAATRTQWPIPPLGDLLTRIMRSRIRRVGVLVAWPGWACTSSPGSLPAR